VVGRFTNRPDIFGAIEAKEVGRFQARVGQMRRGSPLGRGTLQRALTPRNLKLIFVRR